MEAGTGLQQSLKKNFLASTKCTLKTTKKTSMHAWATLFAHATAFRRVNREKMERKEDRRSMTEKGQTDFILPQKCSR
jgi:hypothetical protein